MEITFRFELRAIWTKFQVHTGVCVIRNCPEAVTALEDSIKKQCSIELPEEYVAEINTEQGDTLYLFIDRFGVRFLSNTEYGFYLFEGRVPVDSYVVIMETISL